jgi:uncharacterized protein (TIGR04255 family)
MRLKNAPLVHVLAQVAFSPILALERYLVDIQGRLAPEYPRFRESTIMSVPLVGPGPATAPPPVVQWEFADRAQRTGIVLTKSSVVLLTTAYGSRESFFTRLHTILSTIQDFAPSTPLVERIGLRYVDLVRPVGDEPYRTYVHMGLLGFPFLDSPKLEAQSLGFLTQSVAKTAHGMLAIRSATLPPGTLLPPDLDPGMLQPPFTPANGGRPGLAVDFDHFTVFDGKARPMDFHPDAILAHTMRLHATLRQAFDTIITEEALKQWGPWISEESP